jgi:hypothetical protein
METELTMISMVVAVSISMVALTTEFMAAPRRVWNYMRMKRLITIADVYVDMHEFYEGYRHTESIPIVQSCESMPYSWGIRTWVAPSSRCSSQAITPLCRPGRHSIAPRPLNSTGTVWFHRTDTIDRNTSKRNEIWDARVTGEEQWNTKRTWQEWRRTSRRR